MARKFILLAACTLSGCSYITYESTLPNGVHYKICAYSIGTTQALQNLSLQTRADGGKDLVVKGEESDQTQALKAVAEGVTKAAVAAIKP